MIPIVYWAKCFCHVWPLAALADVNVCGWCREFPENTVDAPVSGRAMSLEEYYAENPTGDIL